LAQKTEVQTAIRKHEKQPDVKLYINGSFTESESGAYFDNVSPFTNEVINRVAKGSNRISAKRLPLPKKPSKKARGEK
jgi:5-carboxymethyl-2-hydroxymuconic-semialdehyde dehydrogenase